MAKGYSARRGFSNGAGQAAQQMQMQQKLMQMQQEMAKAQQEVEEATFTASVGGGAVSAAANGALPIEIARTLNAQGTPSPAVYRCMTHEGLDVNQYSQRQE